MKNKGFNIKSSLAGAVAVWVAVLSSGLISQAQVVDPRAAVQGGPVFNNNTVAGAVANAALNPLGRTLQGYDECFSAELRIQTRIYNPLIDPVTSIVDQQKALQAKYKTFIDKKPTRPECQRPERGKKADKGKEKELQDCKQKWKDYDADYKAWEKGPKEEAEKEKKKAQEELAILDGFNWGLPGVESEKGSGEIDSTKTARALGLLENMAANEGIGTIDMLPPNPLSCSLLGDPKRVKNLEDLLSFQQMAIKYSQNRLKTYGTIVQCLEKKAGANQQQVQSLVSQFQQQYNSYSMTLTNMHGHITERERILKSEFPQLAAMGDIEIHKVRDRLEEFTTGDKGLWSRAAELQNQLIQLEQDRQNTESFYMADVANTAMSCFTTGSIGASSTKDLRDGVSTGGIDRFANLVGDTIANTAGDGGIPSVTVAVRTDRQQLGAQTKNDIKNRFAAIAANVPKPAEGSSAPGGTGAFRSEQAIKSAITSQFSGFTYYIRRQDGSFDGTPYNLAASMNALLGECFRLSRGTKDNPSEPYIRRQNAMTKLESSRNTLNSELSKSLAEANKIFVTSANVLKLLKRSPAAHGVDLNNCNFAGTAQGMKDCYDRFKGLLHSMYAGGPDMVAGPEFGFKANFVAPVPMPPALVGAGITGKTMQTIPQFTPIRCNGIRECVQKLDQEKARLEADVNDIKGDHLKAAQFATRQIQQMGFQISNQSAPVMGMPSMQQSTNDLMTKINMLRNEMATTFNVDVGGEVPLIPPADWTPISGENNPLNGFVEMPKDPVSAIAAGTIDFRKDPFAGLRKGLNGVKKSIDEQNTKLTKYRTDRSEAKKKCDDEKKKESEDIAKSFAEKTKTLEGCAKLQAFYYKSAGVPTTKTTTYEESQKTYDANVKSLTAVVDFMLMGGSNPDPLTQDLNITKVDAPSGVESEYSRMKEQMTSPAASVQAAAGCSDIIGANLDLLTSNGSWVNANDVFCKVTPEVKDKKGNVVTPAKLEGCYLNQDGKDHKISKPSTDGCDSKNGDYQSCVEGKVRDKIAGYLKDCKTALGNIGSLSECDSSNGNLMKAIETAVKTENKKWGVQGK